MIFRLFHEVRLLQASVEPICREKNIDLMCALREGLEQPGHHYLRNPDDKI